MKKKKGLPVRLEIISRDEKRVKLRVLVEGLKPDRKCRLIKFHSLKEVIVDNTDKATITQFTAKGETWRIEETVGLDDVVIYRIH